MPDDQPRQPSPPDSKLNPYNEDRDEIIWLVCFGLTIFECLFGLSSYHVTIGTCIGTFIGIFLLGYVVVKIAVAAISRRPMVARTAFVIAGIIICGLSWFGQQRMQRANPASPAAGNPPPPDLSPAMVIMPADRVNQFINRFTSRMQQYDADTSQIFADGLMKPDLMDTAPKLDELHQRLTQFRATHAAYVADVRAMFKSLSDGLGVAPTAVPSSEPSSPPSTMPAEELALVRDAMEKFIGLDDKTFDAVGELETFLRSRLGTFSVNSRHHLVFTSADDLAAFHQINARIVAAGNEQPHDLAKFMEQANALRAMYESPTAQ